MRKQRKQLPDLRSMIGGSASPDGPGDDKPKNQETTEPKNKATANDENQENKKPVNQNSEEPQNLKAAKPKNQGGVTPAEIPTVQANSQAAEAAVERQKHERGETAAQDANESTPRLPPVQVCVWVDPEVAGMIDTVRGMLATRLPKRPTRSKLVEAVLRKGLNDHDALVELLQKSKNTGSKKAPSK